MSIPMHMGSYSTKHLLKIVTRIILELSIIHILVIRDPWVDRIEFGVVAARRARAVAGRAALCDASSDGS